MYKIIRKAIAYDYQMNFAGYRPSQSHLDEDDDDGGGWIPPHTPPRPELLQTCPMDLNVITHKAVDDADNSTEVGQWSHFERRVEFSQIEPEPIKTSPESRKKL